MATSGKSTSSAQTQNDNAPIFIYQDIYLDALGIPGAETPSTYLRVLTPDSSIQPKTLEKSPSALNIFAAISAQNLRFIVSDHKGDDFYIWSYKVTITNSTAHKIQLIGRHWNITRLIIDPFNPFGGRFAPSVGGNCPVLEPNGATYSYEAGVARKAPGSFCMGGAFQAIDFETGACEITVPVSQFEQPSITPEKIRIGQLSVDASNVLRDVVRQYNEAVLADGAALLRTDELAMSPDDRKLVTAFLIAEGQTDPQKARSCDFAPIMWDNSKCLILMTNDHYFLAAEYLEAENLPIVQRLEEILALAHEKMEASNLYRVLSFAIEINQDASKYAQHTFDFIAIRSYNYLIVLRKAPYNGAALEEELKRLLVRASEELGKERVKEIIAAFAPPGDGALGSGMEASVQVRVAAEQLARRKPYVAKTDLRAEPSILGTSPPLISKAKREIRLPNLPDDLEWPTSQYDKSEYFGKRDGIVKHLRENWLKFIERNILNRSLLAHFDRSAEIAVRTYLTNNGNPRSLPEDVRIPTLEEFNDRLLASGTVPPSERNRLASAAWRRGIKLPK